MPGLVSPSDKIRFSEKSLHLCFYSYIYYIYASYIFVFLRSKKQQKQTATIFHRRSFRRRTIKCRIITICKTVIKFQAGSLGKHGAYYQT